MSTSNRDYTTKLSSFSFHSFFSHTVVRLYQREFVMAIGVLLRISILTRRSQLNERMVRHQSALREAQEKLHSSISRNREDKQ